VGRSLVSMLQTSYFWEHLWITVSEILTGFAIAVFVGTALGVLLGKSRLFERIAAPPGARYRVDRPRRERRVVPGIVHGLHGRAGQDGG